MSSILLGNVLVAGLEEVIEADVLVADGNVAAVLGAGSEARAERRIDCGGLTIFPGFIDVHNHGAVGFDVNVSNANDLQYIAAYLAKNGVTAWMPTLVPDSDESYRESIDAIDELMRFQAGFPIAQAVGVHYEGVFANEKMCGALRPQHFKNFRDISSDFVVYAKIETTNQHEKSRSSFAFGLPLLVNGVHMTTFAPEIDGGVELAAELTRQGWIASIGHTRADVETLNRAFTAGARHVTHFFNAMSGIHHRDVGVAGWALTNTDVTFDIIADGIHVNPQMLEFACRSKTPEKTLLISDSVAPTGLGDGNYRLWGETITVEKGKTKKMNGSIAGSVINMHDAVMQMRKIGFTDVEIAKMASLNPAKLLGLDAAYGSIEPGKRADLVALDDDGKVKMTIIGGRIAFVKID